MLASMRLGAALACLSLGGVLRAELQWRERHIALEPPAGAAAAPGEFVFVNRGTHPIRVTDVRSSCDCTVMAVGENVVLPGAKGRIPFVFHVGARRGRQSVAIAVTTHEPEVRNYELTVEVEIKDFALITPRLVFWNLGAEPEAKLLQVSLAFDFRFVGAESSSHDFSVEVGRQVVGGVQLRVTPRDTWAKRNGSIKIKVAKDSQPPIEVLAQVRVQ
jgi:hypothetical protein